MYKWMWVLCLSSDIIPFLWIILNFYGSDWNSFDDVPGMNADIMGHGSGLSSGSIRFRSRSCWNPNGVTIFYWRWTPSTGRQSPASLKSRRKLRLGMRRRVNTETRPLV